MRQCTGVCSARRLLLFVILGCVCNAYGQQQPIQQSWAEVRKAGNGIATVLWYESQPFIYSTPEGMKGIEAEIMEGFRKFVKRAYQVDLKLVWREGKSFGDTYATMRENRQAAAYASSAFSITPERRAEVGFTPPYMSDISVLITSQEIPIVQTMEEFDRVFSQLTAVTIEETTYEQDIFKLKEQRKLPFNIAYIRSSDNILEAIEARDSAFAFIDLPVYMMMFSNNPGVKVKRQNLFPVKREGYAFTYPHGSDWAEPMEAYFSSPHFLVDRKIAIGHYIDKELFNFIESLAIQSNEMVVLLTREKEIQSLDILDKSARIAQDTRTRNILIALVCLTFLFLLIIGLLFRKRIQQQKKIEAQRKSIEQQNELLEKRNEHLLMLDEEKNNLIKMLAHDLRTPITHVHGLTQVLLMGNEPLQKDQKVIIERIKESSVRLNKMISNILDIDSIEHNRVKLVMEEVSLNHLVSEVVQSFDKQAAQKNLELALHLNGKASMRGDCMFLTQVFENLISNAIKFSDREGKIDVSIASAGETVLVSVKDMGPGLTPEDQKMLFRKFQKLSAKPTGGENSTGLGLSIVKKYVEMMDGKVWCESEAGKGATFIVSFKTI
jgi:signal transduction histidine kinase